MCIALPQKINHLCQYKALISEGQTKPRVPCHQHSTNQRWYKPPRSTLQTVHKKLSYKGISMYSCTSDRSNLRLWSQAESGEPLLPVQWKFTWSYLRQIQMDFTRLCKTWCNPLYSMNPLMCFIHTVAVCFVLTADRRKGWHVTQCCSSCSQLYLLSLRKTTECT